MAKFDAHTSVEQLEYDFTFYGGSAGVIPEPTTEAVNEFFRQVARSYKVITGKVSEDPMQTSENLKSMTSEEAEEISVSLVDALVQLGAGTPSKDDLEKLPYRVLSAYVGWIAGQISPEA